MLPAAFLANAAGGGRSGFGGFVQRSIRKFRKVLRDFHHGEKPKSTPCEPEQALVKFQPIQQNTNVCRDRAFSALRSGARGILSDYLARNQMCKIASEIRSRYAFQFMSGSARLNLGISRKIAMYGFVGVGLSGVVQNRFHARDVEGSDTVECTIQDLFKKKPEVDPVPEPFSADDKELELSGFRPMSISDESDIVILSDDDLYADDFEMIEVNKISLCLGDRTELEGVKDLLIKLETENEALRHDNAALSKALQIQTAEDDNRVKELHDVLKTVEVQQNELEKLKDLVQYQNSLLIALSKQFENGGNRMKKFESFGVQPSPGLGRIRGDDKEHSYVGAKEDLDMEKLRAAGGRVRGLKIHRKKRMKNAA